MIKKRPRNIAAEDLYEIRALNSCELSPDGSSVVYCIGRNEMKNEEKFSDLWIADVKSGRSFQFTYGDHHDFNPVWSPDGKYIAFLSNRKDEFQFQIYIIPFSGGEARPVTDLKGYFGDMSWSADSRKILFQFQKTDKSILEAEKDEERKKLGIVERHVKRIFFKEDETGYNPEERWHVWVTGLTGFKARQLTKDNLYEEGFSVWSPDRQKIAFISNRSHDPDMNPFEESVYTMPATGGELTELKTPAGMKMHLSYSPDGKYIACIGQSEGGRWWRDMDLLLISADNEFPAINLTEGQDINIDSVTCADITDAELSPPCWSNDSSEIYFQVSWHGRVILKKIHVQTREITDVINEEAVIGRFSLDRNQQTLVYYRGTLVDPGQVWVMNLKTGHRRQLTALNRELFRSFRKCQIEEIWIKSRDNTDIQGWIMKPPGFRKNRQYPSILQIHGGPHMQFGYHYLHEFFFLASRGFVVYFCNPRGSDGYGEEFKKTIEGRLGTVDYNDIMDWDRHVCSLPYIDKSRRGVTGGSYGGFMTNWIIGKTNEFKAAVTQRSICNQISFWGTSDFNWTFQSELGDKTPWEDIDNYWNQSPLKYLKNARTPTLVIHSEHDFRCDIEQGEQLFVALKYLGVDTEMITFPEESHGLSRIGRTDRRISRLKHILRWFESYLK